MPDKDAAASFSPLRSRLNRIAYRMLGSVAEAEDVVQDAYLRWHQADRSQVREPAAFLVRTVTRLCLDVLKSARVQREQYIGPWLPEPVIDAAEDDSDGITLTLMMALERLSPLERAAFLLHDVFGVDFHEIAQAIGRDSAACRQLASRARSHVRDARPRYPVLPERGKEIAAAFFAASRNGDMQALKSLLAGDVVAYTDGGGKLPSALKPIYGQDRVARFFVGMARKPWHQSSPVLEECTIDGLPGFVTVEREALQTTSLAIEDDRIAAIYIVRNPDKLRHIDGFRHRHPAAPTYPRRLSQT
jgi:RNA polymerase sigma-70 factor (ECF subfamily)